MKVLFLPKNANLLQKNTDISRIKWVLVLKGIIFSETKYVFLPLREKCPNTEFFLVRIQSKYRKIWTGKNSIFGHFSGSIHTKFQVSNTMLTSLRRGKFTLLSSKNEPLKSSSFLGLRYNATFNFWKTQNMFESY